jgi:hypothetical protein
MSTFVLELVEPGIARTAVNGLRGEEGCHFSG